MPYTVVEGCPLYVDRRLMEKTHWRLVPGTSFKVDEVYPLGEPDLAKCTVKTLGKVPVVDKSNPTITSMEAGWVEGRFIEQWTTDPQEGELPGGEVPTGPTFEEMGRAVVTIARGIKARL